MSLTALQKLKIAQEHPSLGVFLLKRKFETAFQAKLESLEEEFSQKLEELQGKFSSALAAVQRIQRGEKGERGERGERGETGLQGGRGEQGLPGRDGKDGLHGLPGPQGPPGRDGKDGESPKIETVAESVIKQLEEQKLPIDVIEGLQNTLTALNRNIAELKSRKLKGGGDGGGGMGNWVTDNFTGNGTTTAFTLTSRVASGGTAIIVLLQGQVQEQSTHYSVSNKTLTFTTAPLNGVAIHAWYSRA